MHNPFSHLLAIKVTGKTLVRLTDNRLTDYRLLKLGFLEYRLASSVQLQLL
jgi:hypothetical protein